MPLSYRKITAKILSRFSKNATSFALMSNHVDENVHDKNCSLMDLVSLYMKLKSKLPKCNRQKSGGKSLDTLYVIPF